MTTIERITTEYISTEDRIRLSGEMVTGSLVVIWLTQRLMQRLLPQLLQGLEKQVAADNRHAEFLHGFKQQAARAALEPQAPVRARSDSASWVVQSVDITQSANAVRLTFKGANEQQASLTLAANPLRQWLAIVHEAYRKAEWPQDVWPVWVREAAAPAPSAAVLH